MGPCSFYDVILSQVIIWHTPHYFKTHTHDYWISSQMMKIINISQLLIWNQRVDSTNMKPLRNRKVVGELALGVFGLLWDWGRGGPPKGGGSCGWERRRENIQRWTEERVRVGMRWVRKGQCRKKDPPPPPPPAVKSNSLTHSEVVSLSERVTITKDSSSSSGSGSGRSGAVGSVRAFGWVMLPRRNKPPSLFLAYHCLDNDCADFSRHYAGCWMMSHRLVSAEHCMWAQTVGGLFRTHATVQDWHQKLVQSIVLRWRMVGISLNAFCGSDWNVCSTFTNLANLVEDNGHFFSSAIIRSKKFILLSF